MSREPFCTVKTAVQNITLMGDDQVQLNIVSTELMDFQKGDKIVIDGDEYTIRTKVTREKLSDDYYTYDAVFYGVMYELMKSLYRNTDANGKSTSSTFDLTYSIKDFVKVIIYNVNRDYPGLWKFDEANCPDTEPRTIQFSRQNCLQVLQALCSKDQFNLEFQITQNDGVRTIHIGKFGERINPPGGNDYFEWGKGNGLYTLKEQKVDDKAIITRLWVEGGTTNIRKDYRNYSERLQLPYPKRLNKREHKLYDGTVVAPGTEMIGIDDDDNRYIEDADLRDLLGSDEDGAQYDDIYPKRTGVVTALGADINSFYDDTMDFDLNESDENGTKYLIQDVTAKITFITGKLAGQQFELAAKNGYDHSQKLFTIIPFTDERGLTIPTTDSEAYRISEGDTYKITDINLPESYEQNAEEDLWYEGYNEFKPRTQAKAQYVLNFDRKYFLDTTPDDSNVCLFKVGDYVPVKDDRFGIEKTIRIQKVSRNLMLKHDYSITLSDTTSISIINQTVIDVIGHEQVIESNRLRDLNKARRGWRTTEELRTMVYDTDGYFDPENIRPNSIDTNMLTVGSKSQQFVLIDVVFNPNVNGLPNRFDATSGILAHLTIDEAEIKQWNMSGAEFTMSESGGYYLFAKCSKKGTTGTWYLTREQLKFEPVEDPNNYYFQVGILSSLRTDDNFRDFVTTYGFTRINGNTITTGKIITSDGECYLDLDGNAFRIGDATSSIDWNVTARKQLTLHNVRLLSDSGDVSHIGVYRGTYNSKYVYYKGDEVSYEASNEVCTYRYIINEPSMGILPTNSAYWNVVAKGSAGKDGTSFNILGKAYAYYETEEEWDKDMFKRVVLIGKIIDEYGATIFNVVKRWGSPFPGTRPGWLTTYANIGDGYIMSSENPTEDGILYVATGSSWVNSGKIKGDDGNYTEFRYAKNGSTSTPPSLSVTSLNPSGWSTIMPTVGTLEYLWMTSAVKSGDGTSLVSNWVTPVRITPYNGKDGQSPATVFRGVYDSSKTYYGTKYRLDVVKYNGIYYVTRIDAGAFSGIIPTNTNKWNSFGAQFESIATDLLLAENANIGGWIFRNNRLESQNNSAFLNGLNGAVRFANGNFEVDAQGNVNVKGNFTGKISTNVNGNRIVIDPQNNAIKMFTNRNGIDYEVLSVEGTDIGFGLLRPNIIMKELSTADNSVMGELVVSAFEIGLYRQGNKSLPFFEVKGGYSSKKIILGDLALPDTKPTTKGQLYRSGDTLKIVL